MKSYLEIVAGEEIDDRGDAFEQVLLDFFNVGVPGLELSFVVTRSFGDEFGEAISGRAC